MRKFNEGDRVIKVENGKIRSGVVERLFADCNVALVRFDDTDEAEKVPIYRIIHEPTPPETDEPETEIPLTITLGEFKNAVVNVIRDEARNNPILEYAFIKFCAELHKALFIEARNG